MSELYSYIVNQQTITAEGEPNLRLDHDEDTPEFTQLLRTLRKGDKLHISVEKRRTP